MIRAGVLIFLLTAAGCSANQTQDDVVRNDSAMAQQGSGGLASSVEVEVRGNTVRLVLHVSNSTNRPVTLEFSSGQRYDFAIRTAEGADVWRWSADKSFIQALESQTLAPGATLQFAESWTGAGKGRYVAVAELTALNHRIQESAQFEIR
ncbi:MAG TPA: BsuPI-related putative proteinase inhibitor [Longimicrobiales bacterium]